MAVQDLDNVFFNQWGPASLATSVIGFFREHLTIRENVFLFPFRDANGNTKMEYWSADRHLVPASSGIWLVCKGFPTQIRHLFISYSATDILCFCHYRSDWLNIADNIAFVALGLVVSRNQISFLKERFVNAKVHTLFEAEITGRVTDCKVALWLKSKDGTFSVDDEIIHISYNKRKFTMPVKIFSLNRFEKIAGIRSGIRTHKSKDSFNSYYDRFINADQ